MITQPYGRLDLSDLQDPSPVERVIYIAERSAPMPSAEPLPSAGQAQQRRQGERRQGDRRQGDRRSAPRVALDIWVEQELGDDVIYLRTGDVSQSGIFFPGVIPYPVGTELTLRIPLHHHSAALKVRGRVVNLSADGTGMGVQFTHFYDDAQQRLEAVLRCC